MKYRDENGDFQDLYFKTGDTLPIGTEVDYDGETAPVGWEEIDNPEEYSTSEVKTNKVWTDGKPIYRKVIRNATASTLNSENNVGNIDNLDEVVSIQGNGLYDSTYTLQFPYIDGTNNVVLYLRNVTTTTRIVVTIGATAISKINIVVEYTKTTD